MQQEIVVLDLSSPRKGSYRSGLYPEIALLGSPSVDMSKDQQIPNSVNQTLTKTDSLPGLVPANQ
jgi:hypothetical protein